MFRFSAHTNNNGRKSLGGDGCVYDLDTDDGFHGYIYIPKLIELYTLNKHSFFLMCQSYLNKVFFKYTFSDI